MATVIRLARYGAKKRPYYHVVVTDSRNARNSGNILAVVGKYNPMLARDDEKRVILNIDEVKAWMAKGAKPSDRVYKFLVKAGLVAAKPVPVQTKKHLQSEKTQMKIKDKAEKLAKIAEEKAAAEAPVETPAEEETVTAEASSETTETVAETPAEDETVTAEASSETTETVAETPAEEETVTAEASSETTETVAETPAEDETVTAEASSETTETVAE